VSYCHTVVQKLAEVTVFTAALELLFINVTLIVVQQRRPIAKIMEIQARVPKNMMFLSLISGISEFDSIGQYGSVSLYEKTTIALYHNKICTNAHIEQKYGETLILVSSPLWGH